MADSNEALALTGKPLVESPDRRHGYEVPIGLSSQCRFSWSTPGNGRICRLSYAISSQCISLYAAASSIIPAFFGTDSLGRDIFSRVLMGARISVIVSFTAVALSVVLGSVIGIVAAYFRRLEGLFMRVIDALWSIPTTLLALAIAITMRPSIGSVIIVIGVVSAPVYARLVFGQALALRDRQFVYAARAAGCGTLKILGNHIFLNLTTPIIVQAALGIGSAVILESSMSFLGIGIQPPTPSWGVMISTGFTWLEVAPWLALFPGLAIYLTVTCYNVLGDKLRVMLDPKQRRVS